MAELNKVNRALMIKIKSIEDELEVAQPQLNAYFL
jgi:hypothetical protein